MIEVKYLEKEQKIIEIECSGHALYDNKGKDIVCSAVSAIMFGGLNALNEKTIKTTIKEGYVKVDLVDENDAESLIILKTMLVQLMTIADNYKKFVSISKK